MNILENNILNVADQYAITIMTFMKIACRNIHK